MCVVDVVDVVDIVFAGKYGFTFFECKPSHLPSLSRSLDVHYFFFPSAFATFFSL